MNQYRSTRDDAGGDPTSSAPDGISSALVATSWDVVVGIAATVAETAGSGADDQVIALLAGPLSGLDPATARPDHLLITAAVLYARAADPVPGLVPDEVAWARYAYRAARTLHGIDHPATIEATDTLALVLSSRDQHDEADALRRDLIQLHLDRGDVDAHLEARMSLAVQRHDVGRCGDAVREATAVWQQWTTRHDPTGVESEPLAWQLAGMLLACCRTGEAETVIKTADLHPRAAADSTASSAQHEYLIALAASGLLHRAVCARNLDRTLTAAADDRAA